MDGTGLQEGVEGELAEAALPLLLRPSLLRRSRLPRPPDLGRCEAAAAAVHGLHRCQADHAPHASVKASGRPGKPELGTGGGWRRLPLGSSNGAGRVDVGDDGCRHWAGPEVVQAVRALVWAAAKAGAVSVEAGGCGKGIVGQPPEGLLPAVLPRQPPQMLHGRLQLRERRRARGWLGGGEGGKGAEGGSCAGAGGRAGKDGRGRTDAEGPEGDGELARPLPATVRMRPC